MIDTEAEQSTEGFTTTREEGDSAELKSFKRRIFWKRSAFRAGGFALLVAQIATVIVAVFAAIPFVLSTFLGYNFSTVLTGSMSGTVEVGDVVVTQDYLGQQLTVGQVVGVENPAGRFLHRIVSVNEDGTYTTKGDANESADLFKPTGDDFWGLPVTYFHQPMATYLTAFSLDTVWMDSFGKALSGGNMGAAFSMLASAPWGFLALLGAVIFFWWLIPDFITFLRNRAEMKDELALETLKLAVAAHEETISTHDESLEEIEPVVEELKHEHEAAKAEKEAEVASAVEKQEAFFSALASIDPENLYDEEPTTEEAVTVSKPLLLASNPFLKLKETTAPEALPALLSESSAPQARTRTKAAPVQRVTESAFDLSAIDD
ncbi:hypothetical protein [Microbacterium sp. KR10-403]|uniref:hypothetical protein n=1 Tax=Microbacterium sp. KR10-403 TaxID=3158581 RepID=UPI0032E4DF2F